MRIVIFAPLAFLSMARTIAVAQQSTAPRKPTIVVSNLILPEPQRDSAADLLSGQLMNVLQDWIVVPSSRITQMDIDFAYRDRRLPLELRDLCEYGKEFAADVVLVPLASADGGFHIVIQRPRVSADTQVIFHSRTKASTATLRVAADSIRGMSRLWMPAIPRKPPNER